MVSSVLTKSKAKANLNGPAGTAILAFGKKIASIRRVCINGPMGIGTMAIICLT